MFGVRGIVLALETRGLERVIVENLDICLCFGYYGTFLKIVPFSNIASNNKAIPARMKC